MNILELMESRKHLPKQGTGDRTTTAVREAIEAEVKLLSKLYKELSIPTIHVTSDIEGTTDVDGTVLAYTYGDYNRRTQHINIYVGSIKEHSKAVCTEDIIAKAMVTLAHEYQHHYQFHGTNSARYIRENNMDKENNTPYTDKYVEVNARAAADWYIERRKPITVRF